MDNLYQRLRDFFEQMYARSEKGWTYWQQVPPHRAGQYMLDHVKKVIDSITKGEGDLKKNCLDLAFIIFVISEKGPDIMRSVETASRANVKEETLGKDTTSNEYWRG